MPIKPENRHLYPPPKERLVIRLEVLMRARYRCEWPGCEVLHGEWGLRDTIGRWWGWNAFATGLVDADAEFERRGDPFKVAYKIILTIAHRDHNPENNGEPGNRPNLAAWCQYHHLAYDRPHHLENARKTREAKKGQETLL